MQAYGTLGLAGLLAAVLAAAPATAQDTIKIGVSQPLTGAFAASGNYVAQGAKIAEDEINKAGGVLGKKIQLVIEDSKSNPT
ncbi:MAG: ABC transporter substrate-binding protein, partial [Rhodospirillales bacterium]|nr:ABC transporter substrate-binding protein [Rhodospirillales bacterium]